MEYRKVKFYSLTAENKDESYCTKQEVKGFIKSIFDKGERTDDGYVYRILEGLDIKYTIEFIDINEAEVFFRIRQPRPKNHYGKADLDNVTLKKLDIDSNEHMESFTFFYIDFETCIISHLKIQGTPAISVFQRFLNNENEFGNGIKYTCDAIATEDIVKSIVNMQKFGTFVYSYVNPNDEVLSGVPGLTDSVRRKMKPKKSTIEVRLSPERSKNLFSEGGVLKSAMKCLRNAFGNNLKKVSINAGDFEDSKMITFNLLNQEFTQETTLRTSDELSIQQYRDAIKMAYNDIKAMLIKYMR